MRIDNPLVFGELTTSGSVDVTLTGSFTGSFSGDGSNLTGVQASLNPNIVSSSAQITALGFISESISSYTELSNIPVGIVSSSTQIDLSQATGIAATASYAISASHEITFELSSSHADVADSVPYSGITGKPTLISSSLQVDYSGSYDTLVVTQNSLQYYIDGVVKPKVTLHKGHTYRFDLSDSSNSGHPFAFRLRDGATSYTNGVIQVGTAGTAGAYTQIHVGQDIPDQLLYYCTVHGNSMGNSVSISSNFSPIIEDGLVVTGSLDVTGDITAFSTSDSRLKTNIVPLVNSLGKLQEIQGYEYDWVESEHHTNTGHDIGVIAQEIEKIAPEAVTTRDSGYKAVRYEKLIPLLIQAINELQNKVKQLENVHR